MTFFLLMSAFMYVGRRLGWSFSKAVLYRASLALAAMAAIAWGVLTAVPVREMLDWQHPGAVLRWVMGYALV